MQKKIEDLTKQEWDTLFPIELVSHNPNWKTIFAEESKQIADKIGNRIIQIEHVGSTSIPGIQSKSYIDISIEVLEENLFSDEIIQGMQDLNYHFFRQPGTDADYMIFVKGYSLGENQEQVFHVHMCPTGHAMLEQITFRDYLIDNPQRAQAYEKLKIDLADKYKNDRSGYRIAKDDFVQETIAMAKEADTQTK